jgi:hypothetical protein
MNEVSPTVSHHIAVSLYINDRIMVSLYSGHGGVVHRKFLGMIEPAALTFVVLGT